jgi:hypothetical protein
MRAFVSFRGTENSKIASLLEKAMVEWRMVKERAICWAGAQKVRKAARRENGETKIGLSH